MKKVCISLILIGIIILSIVVGVNNSKPQTGYLRIHIRAYSNSEEDQLIKYKVKDAVVEFLTPIVAQNETVEQAKASIGLILSQIEAVADNVLKENGFSYRSQAKLCVEDFPTRVYDGVTLEQGLYDALILNLGDGKGDNWWCVVYPPLCFTGANQNFVYKSKIMEIINNFKNGSNQQN